MMKREEAFNLLKDYTSSDSLIKHALAVEAAMIGYAEKFGEDVAIWGNCGLLHDIDFEKYPETHPLKGIEILREQGFSEEFLMAVKGHADHDMARETLMAKTLYAVDELASFVIAVVLVRPNRFEGLKPKSVKKKFKAKAFAKAVDRDAIAKGAEELDVDMTEHIQTVIDALVKRQKDLEEEGLSLI